MFTEQSKSLHVGHLILKNKPQNNSVAEMALVSCLVLSGARMFAKAISMSLWFSLDLMQLLKVVLDELLEHVSSLDKPGLKVS